MNINLMHGWRHVWDNFSEVSSRQREKQLQMS